MTIRKSNRVMRNGIGALVLTGAIAVGGMLWASYNPCEVADMLAVPVIECFRW